MHVLLLVSRLATVIVLCLSLDIIPGRTHNSCVFQVDRCKAGAVFCYLLDIRTIFCLDLNFRRLAVQVTFGGALAGGCRPVELRLCRSVKSKKSSSQSV